MATGTSWRCVRCGRRINAVGRRCHVCGGTAFVTAETPDGVVPSDADDISA